MCLILSTVKVFNTVYFLWVTGATCPECEEIMRIQAVDNRAPALCTSTPPKHTPPPLHTWWTAKQNKSQEPQRKQWTCVSGHGRHKLIRVHTYEGAQMWWKMHVVPSTLTHTNADTEKDSNRSRARCYIRVKTQTYCIYTYLFYDTLAWL